PAGRWLTIFISTVSLLGPPPRAFSSSRASCVTCLNSASSFWSSSALSERISISIQAVCAMEFTDVPPSMRPTLKVVLGCLGTLEAQDFLEGAAHGWNRTRHSECAVAVPAGAANRHSVPHNTDGRVCDTQPRPVNRDEMRDLAFEFVIEEAPNPAQVPQA